jgi:hypothetical protein
MLGDDMTWNDYAHSPSVLSHWFISPPPLDHVELIEIWLDNHAPLLLIAIRLPVRPDKGSRAADAGIRSTDILLNFWEIREIRLEGWARNNFGAISICPHPESGSIEFSFHSDSCTFAGKCAYFDVSSVSFMSESIATERKARLFSHYNVWNSCVLLALSQGFTVAIIGKPDVDNQPTHCGWKATKDNVELHADNPIELAGLIALHNHQPPNAPKDYWWRIEGPNLVQSAIDEWEAKHFGPRHSREGNE